MFAVSQFIDRLLVCTFTIFDRSQKRLESVLEVLCFQVLPSDSKMRRTNKSDGDAASVSRCAPPPAPPPHWSPLPALYSSPPAFFTSSSHLSASSCFILLSLHALSFFTYGHLLHLLTLPVITSSSGLLLSLLSVGILLHVFTSYSLPVCLL